jgi:hypothetical protein
VKRADAGAAAAAGVGDAGALSLPPAKDTLAVAAAKSSPVPGIKPFQQRSHTRFSFPVRLDSKNLRCVLHCPQTISPHCRQWWRRVKMPN